MSIIPTRSISLAKDEIPDNHPSFNFSLLRLKALRNRFRVEGVVPEYFSRDQSRFFSKNFFSIDGSLKVEKDVFVEYAPPYFYRSRRIVVFRDAVHLRGGRYLISANPTFELRTKLKTFSVDFHEGVDAIPEINNAFFLLAVADYVKNSIITILNAFLHEEKVGKYRLENLSYQNLRKNGQALAQSSVDLFYGIFIDRKDIVENSFNEIVRHRSTIDKMIDNIISRYEDGIFSSRHISRPEASHPLIIAMSAAKSWLVDSARYDSVIGMPSGSTELCLAHSFASFAFRNKRPETILLPVSIHSIKTQSDFASNDNSNFHRLIKNSARYIEKKNILICDDNSSTGTTLDIVHKAVSLAAPAHVDISVAEADITRSKIDRKSQLRPKIADASVYNNSVGVLPVSKHLSPKMDLREIVEIRKMISCTKSRYFEKDTDLPKHIMGSLYLDMLKISTAEALDGLGRKRLIGSFRRTELSNFFPADIFYNGSRFDSVEHAYQSTKFPASSW